MPKEEGVSVRTNDEVCIENIQTSGLTLKEGVHFRIEVRDVAETVTFSLLIWNPETDEHDDYEVQGTIDLKKIFPEYEDEIDAYLADQNDVDTGAEFDPSMFDPGFVAMTLMDMASLRVEAGGPEVNVYIDIDVFSDMVTIERLLAEDYADFDKSEEDELGEMDDFEEDDLGDFFED